MKYKIIENPTYTNTVKVGLEIEPENEPVKFFFSSMRLNKYPELIHNILNNTSYMGDPQGVLLYNDLDEEDLADDDIFEKDEVKIYHHIFGESILPKKLFDEMLYDISRKLLEVYGCDDNISLNWKQEMEMALEGFNQSDRLVAL